MCQTLLSVPLCDEIQMASLSLPRSKKLLWSGREPLKKRNLKTPLTKSVKSTMAMALTISKIFVAWIIVFTMSTSDAFATESNSEVPQLPPPDPNDNLPTIRLGETISFEEFGPVILNTDGSTRRIANWDILTEAEKKVTWRRISKRNEERRKALLEKQAEEEKHSNEKNGEL